MIVGFKLSRKNTSCSKLNAIFKVETRISAAGLELGHLSIPLSFSRENFKKIWGGQLCTPLVRQTFNLRVFLSSIVFLIGSRGTIAKHKGYKNARFETCLWRETLDLRELPVQNISCSV